MLATELARSMMTRRSQNRTRVEDHRPLPRIERCAGQATQRFVLDERLIAGSQFKQ